MQKAQGRFGIKVEEPSWIEVPKGQDRDAMGYVKCIKADLNPKTLIAVVVINNK